MRRMLQVCCIAAGCMATGLAMGQAPTNAQAAPKGPAEEVQRSYQAVQKNIIKAAENMPAESYSYKPEPDIRIFGRIVNHVTEAQLHSCGAINGDKTLPTVPPETAPKEQILAALKVSFALCDNAYGSATDANLADPFTVGKAQRSRIGILWGNVSHDNEQYAALALYMRLKGLTPPSSEK